MVIALSTKDEWEFTAPQDDELPEEKRTTWILGRLSIEDEAWVTDLMTTSTGVPMGTAMRRLLPKYLRGVRNWKDGAGEDVVLERKDGFTTSAALARIPRDVKSSITRAVILQTGLEAADAKKSEQPST